MLKEATLSDKKGINTKTKPPISIIHIAGLISPLEMAMAEIITKKMPKKVNRLNAKNIPSPIMGIRKITNKMAITIIV